MAISGPTTNHDEIRQWAERNGAVPTEVLPDIVDSVPTELRFMYEERVERESNVRALGWEEFFRKFDALG